MGLWMNLDRRGCWVIWFGRSNLLLGLLAITTACGFHLRGDWQLDEGLSPVSVSDNGSESKIKLQLLRGLRDAGVPLAIQDEGKTNIQLEGEQFSKRLLSATDIASIDTYDVQYQVRYKVTAAVELIAWQDLILNRTLQFSKSAVLSSATEEAALRDDLVSEAAEQIVGRLRFLQPSKPPDAASVAPQDAAATAGSGAAPGP